METLSYCQLMQRCGELEAQVKQLAAENAALKSAIEFSEPWLPSCDDELLHRIKMTKQTPATDAILASLRAEGVEMFGKWAGSLGEWHRNKWVEVKAIQFADNLRSKSEVQS